MKQRQNECFLRNSEKSHQVWYSRKNDPTFKVMMQKIEKEIDSSAYVHRKIPLSWLKCIDAIKEKKISWEPFQLAQPIHPNLVRNGLYWLCYLVASLSGSHNLFQIFSIFF